MYPEHKQNTSTTLRYLLFANNCWFDLVKKYATSTNYFFFPWTPSLRITVHMH